MASPAYSRSIASAFKRLKISPSVPARLPEIRSMQTSAVQPASVEPTPTASALPPSLESELNNLRLPKAVQATYLNPLKHETKHHVVAADLQLRSYNVRNLEVFADFALRAAYFLGLPAKGPIPLKKITERWTVPRSNFVHKKSQENFERITRRRWIRIYDGHQETVAIWLAFLKKHQYYGVGLKADVWEHGGLDTGKELSAAAESVRKVMGEDGTLDLPETYTDQLFENISPYIEKHAITEHFKGQFGAHAPLGASKDVPYAKARVKGLQSEENKSETPKASDPVESEPSQSQ